MLIGLPGTGKTILAQQYLFANATLERPALYLSTVSEPFDKIVRYGQSLRFFDPERSATQSSTTTSAPLFNERGLAGVLEQVTALIKERRPGIIVIDSFKALRPMRDAAEFRRFLHDFAGRLSAFPASSFWIGEYGEEEIADAPGVRGRRRHHQPLHDASVRARDAFPPRPQARGKRIRSRPARLPPLGQRDRRLSAAGRPDRPTSYPLDGRISSGIAALDDMLADGYWPGASTLCRRPLRLPARHLWDFTSC